MGLDGAAVREPAGELARRIGRGEARIGLGVPDLGVDAVDDAVQHARPVADEAVKAHAEGGRGDLDGIGRADGGDRGGIRETGLQEADALEIFQPVDRPGGRGQFQPGEDVAREMPWKAMLWTVRIEGTGMPRNLR